MVVVFACGMTCAGLADTEKPTSLAVTADEVERTMERFLDANGVLMSHLDRNYRPYVGDDPPGSESITLPGIDATKGEFRTYENTGMVQGAFLAAMCAKWRAVRDPAALEKAHRTYAGIRKTYAVSAPGGKGFYCKPWGWRYQDETSSDQYVYTLAGLAAYERLLTDEATRAEVRAMIVDLSAWWRERNYEWKYYTLPLKWQKCRFLSFAAWGARFEKGHAAADELQRLLADSAVTNDVPFRAKIEMGRTTLPDGTPIYSGNGENAFSGFLSVWSLLEDRPDCAYARAMLPIFHERAVASLAGDGTCYGWMVRRPDGTYAEMPRERTVIRRPAGKPPWNWYLFGVRGPYRHGGQASATAVNALVQMAPYYGPSADWVRTRAVHELAAIAAGHFTWYEDPHGILPPELKWMTDVRSGDAVANWLWAYWTIRAETSRSGALVPFLAVTGRPTETGVVRKVEALRRDGFHSVLVYPRYGLELDYLGEDWFRMMGWFCREAKRRGMKIWLYDEFGFPSGSCNGRVTTESGAPPTYRLTEQGVFRNDDGTFRRENRYANKEVGNVFDRGAVRRFVELTHEAYSARLKSYFDDGTIVAVFTDEPGTPIGPHWPVKPLVRYAVWEGLEEEYRAATKGRDFAADVDAFLRDESKADVWKTYSTLKGKRFRDVFYGTVNDWCRRVGVRSTGHLTEELCMIGGPLVQGDLLHVLKGETLPGMDEIFTNTAKTDIEWITLAAAQHAIARGEGGGLVELFALGPNDMSAARMRQMIWLEALHGVDTYLVSMEVMDQRGLLSRFQYLSPVQEGQPWHKDLRVLADEANRAARFARKTDFACEVAVRYPQADAAVDTYRLRRGVFKWNTLMGPALRPLLAELRGRQTDVDLIEETERTDRRFVFRVEGEKYVEERSGERFASARAAADWILARTSPPVRAYEADGSVADDLIVRCFGDGSAVLLNLHPDSARNLVVARNGERMPVAIPFRGVCVMEPGMRPAAAATESRTPVDVPSWNVSFDGPNLHRLVLDDRGFARFSVEGAKDLRLVLQVVPETPCQLDGKPVVPVAACTSLPVEYRPLYREVPLPDLADGEHVLARLNGQAETNFFLPQAFVAGRFAERGARLEAPSECAEAGPLEAAGLGSYVGDVVYSASVRAPKGDDVRLVLPKAEAFVRVRWNGEDLGVRAWAPYEWRLPQGTAEGTLEIVVSTSVVNMLGAPEAVKRARLRGSPRDRRTSEGLAVQPVWSVRRGDMK